MSNTLTGLIATVYTNLDIVSRELVGFIPSVSRDPKASRAAKNQTVRSFMTRAATASDITPGVTPPDDGDNTLDYVDMSITKVRRTVFRWNGEEELSLSAENNGPGSENIQNDEIQQCFRTLVNEMEADLYAAAWAAASRAYGTAATAPFASDLSDTAQIRKILDDNGAPASDRSLIIDTTAGAKARTLAQLTKANEAGTTMTLRDGQLLDIHNLSMKESAAVVPVTKGTGASYQLNGTHAVGATTINVDTGTGTVLAGDFITIANGTPADTHKYMVTTALSGGVLTIGAPGLRCAHVDNDAVTVGGTATRNMAFHRSAIQLATRLPALPKNGDLARDRTTITDPRSGISFELAMYPQYRQMQYEISAAWGVKGVKPAHTTVLLG